MKEMCRERDRLTASWPWFGEDGDGGRMGDEGSFS
jgi:hypothetical protein